MSGNAQLEFGLATLPEYHRRVWQIHDDYLDLLEDWSRWQQTYQGEIQVWSTIRSLLIESRELDGDGDLPPVGDLLEQLGIEGWSSELPADERDALWEMVMAADIDPENDNFDAVRDYWTSEPGLVDELMNDEWTIGQSLTATPDGRTESIENRPPEETPFVEFTRAVATRLILLEYHAQQLRLHLEQPVPIDETSPYVRLSFSADPLGDADEDDVLDFETLFHETTFVGSSPFWEAFETLPYEQQQRLIDKLASGLSATSVGRDILRDLATGDLHEEFRSADLFCEPTDRETLVTYPQSVFDDDGKFTQWSGETERAMELACLLVPGYAVAATDGEFNGAVSGEIGRLLYAFHAEPAVGNSIPARLADGATVGEASGEITPAELRTFLDSIADKGVGSIASGVASSWTARHGLSDFADNLPQENLSLLHDTLRIRAADSSEDVVDSIVEQLDLQDPLDDIDLPEKSAWVRAAEGMERFVTIYRGLTSTCKVFVLIANDDDPDSWDEHLEDLRTWLGIKDVLVLADQFEGAMVARGDGTARSSARLGLNRAIQGVETTTVTNMTGELNSLIDQTLDKAHTYFVDLNGLDGSRPFGPLSIGDRLDRANRTVARFSSVYQQTGELTAEAVTMLNEAINDLDRVVGQLRANIQYGRLVWGHSEAQLEALLTSVENDVRTPLRDLDRDFRQFASLDVADDLQAVRHITSSWGDPSGRDVAVGYVDEVERQRTALEIERELYRMRNRDVLFARFVTRSLIQLASVLADAIGIVLAVKDVSDAISEKDYGAAVGAGLVGLGSVGLLGAAFLSGPVGWAVAIPSALLVVAGIGTTMIFSHTPLEEWIKYTYFGTLRNRHPDSPEHPHWGYSISYRSALDGRIDVDQYWQRQMSGYYTLFLGFDIIEATLEETDDGLPALSVNVGNVSGIGYGSVFLIRLLTGDPAPAGEDDTRLLWFPHRGLVEVIDEDGEEFGIIESWIEYYEPPGGGAVFSERVVNAIQESSYRELAIDVKNVRTKTTLRYGGVSDDDSNMTGADFEISLAEDKSDDAEWSPLANLLGVDDETFFREDDPLERYVEVVHAPLALHMVLDAMPGLSGADPAEVAETLSANFVAPRTRTALSVEYSGVDD
ncbi:hypothetical protein [Natronorubrum sp. DTA7]|uniref:hypothetical protein n=1 Tax=Natronorubrum sp. DTA7 TaxID=3447016 RepID=UPI003F826C2A